MTKLTISIKNLREIIDLLNTIVSEAKLKLDLTGLNVKAVDSAHVAMIDIHLPREAFLEYDVEQEDELTVDVEKLKGIIKLASSNDAISMIKENERLKFKIGSISKSIPLLDNSSVVTPKIPSIHSESYVVIKKSELERGLKAAEDVSDAIKLIMKPDEFRARSASESEDSELILEKSELSDLNCGSEVKSSYPLDYLLRIVKSLSSSEELKLSFKDDYPLSIEFKPSKEGVEGLSGFFLLAPRMDH
ncbi:MAG: DNA polymerase sliding clamp [Thermoplasmataceae archaeon]